MISELKPFEAAWFWSLFPEAPLSLLQFIERADDLQAWYVDGAPIAMWGACPVPEVVSCAYIWGYNTPAAAQHPVAYALRARQLIKATALRYKTLIGHVPNSKCRYMRTLGATFYDETDGMFNFIIRRSDVHPV